MKAILTDNAKALNIKPFRGTKYSAGLDLQACINDDLILYPLKPVKIPLGVCIELPNNTCGLIKPRSGLSSKGLFIVDGTIDCDYRGELKAIAINLTNNPMIIKPAQRIAQLIVLNVLMPNPVFVDELSETKRGLNGFGSTGI